MLSVSAVLFVLRMLLVRPVLLVPSECRLSQKLSHTILVIHVLKLSITRLRNVSCFLQEELG